MKSSRGLPLIAYILLGLLALSFALLSLGRRESVAEPSADSYGPSGASAFAELLRKQGHRVRVSTRKNPELLSSDLVIAFYVRHEPTWSDLGIKSPDELEEEIEVPGRAALERHLNGGGKALVLELDQGFREASRIGISGQTKLTNVVDGTVRRVSKLDGLEPTDFAEDWISTLWIDESEAALVHGREQGRGLVVHANAGLLGTNRFIARDDNAAFLLGLVSSLAPPKSQIVFHEAYWGRIVEPSLMELLGPWAQAAWTQILVLFVILAYALGRRFGLPEVRRRTQLGTRQLVDALANTYRRARATDAALGYLARDADKRTRRTLKLPTDATAEQRNALLPEGARKALMKAEAATKKRIRPAEALGIARDLDREMLTFFGQEPKRQRSKRKHRG